MCTTLEHSYDTPAQLFVAFFVQSPLFMVIIRNAAEALPEEEGQEEAISCFERDSKKSSNCCTLVTLPRELESQKTPNLNNGVLGAETNIDHPTFWCPYLRPFFLECTDCVSAFRFPLLFSSSSSCAILICMLLRWKVSASRIAPCRIFFSPSRTWIAALFR